MATPGQIKNNEELRIVMVGKTGIGKSATGNTILGRKCFESKLCAMSMTVDCSKGRGTVDGQEVAVIDTPGLFDTRYDEEKTTKDLSQCISYAAPGPHVFLVVISVGRFTQEEMMTVQKIQEIFGQAADKYSMVLFTHGDQLEDMTIEEFLSESPDLQKLVDRCNGQYHVFNNKRKDKQQQQVTELLQKIRDIVKKNGGDHYTNEMFQEAERALEEEKQRILKEKEEANRNEREELEKKLREKYEMEMNKLQELFQADRERERKEREDERKREREERDKERAREKEEWKEKEEKMNEERKREREEMKEDREREKKEWMEREDKMNKERKREREEVKEDREREKKEWKVREEKMYEERKREREEWEDREEERRREEREREMRRLQEQHERELREQKENLQKQQGARARQQAEKAPKKKDDCCIS